MNFRQYAPFVCALFLASLAWPASAMTDVSCAHLARNLHLGISGDDVRNLQIFLNSNTETRIATSGAGSPGNETNYFGSLTKTAVIRFQNLYKKEVLTPAGLNTGSGFVGSMTRAKIASMCASPNVKQVPATQTNKPSYPSANVQLPTTVPTPAPSSSAPSQNSSAVNPGTLSLFGTSTGDEVLEIMYPSSYQVSTGSKVGISGTGFTSDNTVHIGSLSIPNVTRDMFGSLNFTVPANAPLGKFDLWVTNSKGESNKSFIVIVSTLTAAPVITGISSVAGNGGATVTLKGTDFTSDGNDVYLGEKVIKNVRSSDHKTLSFSVNPGDIVSNLSSEDIGSFSLSVWVYMVNTNGVSNGQPYLLNF